MNFARKLTFPIVALLVFLPLIHLRPFPVAALQPDPIELVCGQAAIDGIIQADEWQPGSANSVTFLGFGEDRSSTLYLMNSHNTLYLGLEIDDDELSEIGLYLNHGDAVRIDFDHDGDGLPFNLGEDVITAVAAPPYFFDNFLFELPGSIYEDITAGGTSNGDAQANRVEQRNHFELQHPLCSGDNLDICLHAGDLFSIQIEYLDAKAPEEFEGSFYYPSRDSTLLLQVSECPVLNYIIYLPLNIK